MQGSNNGWCNTWVTSCHAHWTWRIKHIQVDGHARPYYARSIIMDRVQDYFIALKWQKDIMGKKKLMEDVRWMPPGPSFVKINVDGSCGKDNLLGCGGAIRDGQGKWVSDFSKFIGACNAFMAEV